MAKPRSTVNSPKANGQVLRAAWTVFGQSPTELFFEHGHWWILLGKIKFSVVDAVCRESVDGFFFERV